VATRAVRLALAACWLLVSSCGSSAGEPPPDRELRLLFIGNSLTYANDLPALVRELGRSDPSRAVVVSSVTYGAYSLEDHWNRGEAQQAIASGQWDYVILQQGPSALPESRVLLIDYVTRFAEEIRRAGARPAIYMVWPPLNREPEWDAVTESYAAAARAVDGLLLPAGEAIREARAANAELQLFDVDGFHPAPAGSYLAALVIFAEAAQSSPVGLSRRAGVTLPGAEAAALESAAAGAMARFDGR